MSTITISMPDSLREFVEQKVKTGGYGNVSEYFRSLVREAQRKEDDDRLTQLLIEGLNSESTPLTRGLIDEIRAEGLRKVAEARTKYSKKS